VRHHRYGDTDATPVHDGAATGRLTGKTVITPTCPHFSPAITDHALAKE
jgi:hypothetical protein